MTSPKATASHKQNQGLKRIQAASLEAALAAMQLIRTYQLGAQEVGASTLKPADRTLVTQVDVLSERAARRVFSDLLPEVPVVGEELGGDKTGGERFIWLDPIDGTKPFVAGAPTPTIMIGSYDKSLQQIEAVTIGMPATGMVWQTLDGHTTKRLFDLRNGQPLTDTAACHVWEGELRHNSIIFIDNSRSFARDGRQILNDNQITALQQSLQPIVDTQNYGSNGIHQALVANGGELATGSITTALGGAWDALGARLVMEAGGVASAFRVSAERTLIPEDPLNPDNFDILLTANNPQNLSVLEESLHHAWAA